MLGLLHFQGWTWVTLATEWVSWVGSRQKTHSDQSVETMEGPSSSREKEPGFKQDRP